MSTLKTNTDGDLAVENNTLVILFDLVAETSQRLMSKFRFFYGEWHLEPRGGMPLYEKVLIKNPDLPALRVLYREAITSDTAVDRLVSLAIDFDTTLRSLSLSFEAELNDGSSLVFTDFILGENR